MPPPALPQTEPLSGNDPNYVLRDVRLCPDPLQQFTPEGSRVEPVRAAISLPAMDDAAIAVVSNPLAPEGSEPVLDLRTPVWLSTVNNMRLPGVNLSLRSFVCGAALGALAMWLLGVQPSMGQKTPQPPPPRESASSIAGVAAGSAASASAGAASPSAQAARVEPEVSEPASVKVAPRSAPGVSSASVPNAASAAPITAAAGRQPTAARPTDGAAAAQRVAAPRPASFRGSLIVRSQPPGARVSVGGEPAGVTPAVLRGVPIGSRVVRVEADGYEAWSASVQVVADQQTQVTARLDPASPAPLP